MNILVLTSAYPMPDDGGVAVTPTVKYFCEKWAEAGHRVLAVLNNSSFPAVFYLVPGSVREKLSSALGHSFPTKESRRPLVTEENGVKIFRLPMTKVIPYKKYSGRKIRKQAEKIEKILSDEGFRPDLILSHWVSPQLELMLELKKKTGAKTSLVFHGDCSPRQIKQYRLAERVKELDAVGCRNESYAKQVKEVLGLDRLPFVCFSGVPDGIARAQLENTGGLERSRRSFLYVGRLVQYKNVDTVIRALSMRYPGGDFEFHIVGEGAEKENLSRLAAERGIGDRVVFHGQIPRTEVFELMKKSSTFIMVSNNETFGMVYIEAMLAGCLTVAAKGGGVDGVIVDGENGFLSEQGDAEDLVRTLTRIDAAGDAEIGRIRKNAVTTAYSYRDSEVAARYLDNVLHRK